MPQSSGLEQDGDVQVFMSLGSGLVGFGCLEGFCERTFTRAQCECKVGAA